jgi:hypothetical protein
MLSSCDPNNLLPVDLSMAIQFKLDIVGWLEAAVPTLIVLLPLSMITLRFG